MTDRPTVVIVGGGASGTLVATQLSRRLHPDGLRIVIVERRGEVGRGLAYSTPWESHRLNVPVEKMGAFPRDAGHFQRWAGAGRGEFLPRRRYGDYLQSVFADALARLRPGVEIVTVNDEAIDAEVDCDCARPSATVHLRDGEPVRADRLVLAIGNLPPAPPAGADPALADSDRYHGDPWDPRLAAAAAGEERVLLIGTGLTMVDIALALASPDGPREIVAVSRNGLLPRAHTTVGGPVSALPFELPHGRFDLDALVADVEARMNAAEENGGDWRHVIDSLRPVTNRIWHRLPPADRQRFVRDVSRHWEVRRHRMAPEIAESLDGLLAAGRLSIRAGGVESLRPVPGGVEVALASGGRMTVDRVANCTGPSLRMGIEGEPVLASLLAGGHVRPGPLGLGLDHESRGALVTAEGRPSRVVYGIGPVRKGHLWETTAIPEIRTQAFELADLLTAQLTSRSAQASRAA